LYIGFEGNGVGLDESGVKPEIVHDGEQIAKKVDKPDVEGVHSPVLIDLTQVDQCVMANDGIVALEGEELMEFLGKFPWGPMYTGWERPDEGESVLGIERNDWMFDGGHVDGNGDWLRLVRKDRTRVPEPGTREAFEMLLGLCDERGWSTYEVAGCLMIRFRDIRDGWIVRDEESGQMRWERNNDPLLALVPTDDRRYE
jgi:hypothetical protein